MIGIACRKCNRRGRLHTATPLACYAAELQMPDLLPLLAKGCPRLDSVSIQDRCGAYYLRSSRRVLRPGRRRTVAMLEVTARKVIELICAWLRDNTASDKLVSSYVQKGATEGWVHVEIADLLGRSFPTNVRVEREVSYQEFAPQGVEQSLQADVVLFLSDSSAIAIELKVESIYLEFLASRRLDTRYRDAVAKIALTDPNVLILICGLAISREANDAMVRMLRKNPGIRQRTQSSVCGRSQDFDITLYWTTLHRPR